MPQPGPKFILKSKWFQKLIFKRWCKNSGLPQYSFSQIQVFCSSLQWRCQNLIRNVTHLWFYFFCFSLIRPWGLLPLLFFFFFLWRVRASALLSFKIRWSARRKDSTYTHNRRRNADIYTNMSLVGFEPKILVLGLLKSVWAFDITATVIGSLVIIKMYLLKYGKLVRKNCRKERQIIEAVK
jgi:hypothetical protein